jgi:dTDP-4-amino-4,6-dideoxygalactose transaminase
LAFPGPFSGSPGFDSETWETVRVPAQGCEKRSEPAAEHERAARQLLAMPIFPELRKDEQQTVVSAIAAFLS